MREIKFRGKKVDKGKWVYGNLTICKNGQYMIGDKPRYYGTIGLMVEVIPETVGQYTGLKDKNKEEIYEGDIVKGETGEIYEVVWDDEAGRFLFVSKFKKYMEGYDLSISALTEVISNIYEY